MEKLLRFNFNQRYVVFDTETEGLNLITSRPWQLSWLVATGKKVESYHDHYLDFPDINVSPQAARVTGFTKKEYIKRKEDPYHVFQRFWSDINREDTLIVGHNILKFDVYIINILRRLLQLPADWAYLPRCLDTNALSVAVKHKLQPPEGANRLAWQYQLAHFRKKGVRTNMAAMLRYFDIPYDEARLHDGRYDMERNFELFQSIINTIDL